MSPLSPRHSGVVAWLTRQLVFAAGDRHEVRVQDTFSTGPYDHLEPDLMVIEPIARDQMVGTALFVVEVAYTSRTRDIHKAADYARADVAEHWIVDVDRDEVLVHRAPVSGAYTQVARVLAGETISPLIDMPPADVSALLAY